MPTSKCDIYHQRVFKEAKGKTINLSGDNNYKLYFEIRGTGASQKRWFVLLDSDGNILIQVMLNKYGGLNPSPGHNLPVGPAHPTGDEPMFVKGFEYVLSAERVFYTDVDLSDQDGLEVYFKIDSPLVSEKRKIIFKTTLPAYRILDGTEIPLDGDAGKKPYESGTFRFFETQKEYRKFIKNK